VPEIALDPEADGGSPLDDLSYFERLSSPDPAPETLDAAAVFVVQVTALSSGGEARVVEAGLVAKGYPAFVVDPVPGGDALYRVRVGPYADTSEANTVRRRLAAEEPFEPFVTKP
jgi:cell division septation protein DedD